MKLCPICKRTWEDDYRVCPIDGLALQAIAVESDAHDGQTVGQARVGEKIADGDQGPIFRAEDAVRGTVAVQFIANERLASPVLMEAFEEAVKQAVRLNHPNVIRTFSLEKCQDGGAAVLMEYVPGTSLAAYSKEHPSLDAQQACRIIKEAAEGVLAAHRLSMLHGSLDPGRILIASDGTVKVGGFHRSGLRDDLPSSMGERSGLAYLAPERCGIIRDIAVPDYRADVYSLGAILYGLVTGKLPYESAKTLQDLGASMEAGPPLPPSFSNPQISPTLSRVILKALSQHPGDRHRSAEDFIHEIDAASQPMREPERDIVEPRYPQARSGRAQEDSGLFAPSPSSSKRESMENIWPEAAEEKHGGEGSVFGWFKTRFEGRSRSAERERPKVEADDSFVPRRTSSRFDEDREERTVVVSGRKRGGRRQSSSDTFAGFGSQGDLTGTDALPHRRFSSKAYIWMAVGGVVVVAGIIALLFFFGGSASGKLMVESTPSGAQVYLNEEFRGNTPLSIPDIKAEFYRLRLQMDGYETVEANVEIAANADVQRTFPLVKGAAPLMVPQTPPLPVTPPMQPPPITAPTPGARAPFEGMFNEALRGRNFFPPSSGNAWDILQSWQQREAAAPTAALTQAKQTFCRELESLGLEKLDQRDFQYVRGILDQARTRMPGQTCTGTLQARFDANISQSVSDLRNSLGGAMNRQNYVTPEADNALKYVRLILHLDPQDAEAKTLENDIYTRSLEQARAKSQARDHQEALNIYLQLKTGYANRTGGQEAISQGIEREKRKLALLSELKVPYSVPVKHGHSFLRVTKRECTGILRADGFNIQFQSSADHSFKVAYDTLKSVTYAHGKIVLEGGTIPGGRIELEQADANPSPSLAEVYAKVEEFRKLREQYMRSE